MKLIKESVDKFNEIDKWFEYNQKFKKLESDFSKKLTDELVANFQSEFSNEISSAKDVNDLKDYIKMYLDAIPNIWKNGVVFDMKPDDFMRLFSYYSGDRFNSNVSKDTGDRFDVLYVIENWDDIYDPSTRTLTIPSSIRKIVSGTLSSRKLPGYIKQKLANLHELKILSPVTTLPRDTFSDKEVDRITLPDSLKYIDRAAFQNTLFLEPVAIPDNVESLSLYNFTRRPLTIILPASLDKIYYESFYGNYNSGSEDLKIYYKSTKNQWDKATSVNTPEQKAKLDKVVKFI